MVWVPAAFAALLLLAVAYPFVEPLLTRERRARKAHRGGIVHWYPNYDEDLQFEPRLEEDIVPVRRQDLISLGYRPGVRSVIVPRTYRRRVPGDVNFQLWSSPDESLRPIWICCWNGIEIPGTVGSVGTGIRLGREMLRRIESRPSPTLSGRHGIPNHSRQSPAPNLEGDWFPVQASAADELTIETSSFACLETSGTLIRSSTDRHPNTPARGRIRAARLGLRRAGKRHGRHLRSLARPRPRHR